MKFNFNRLEIILKKERKEEKYIQYHPIKDIKDGIYLFDFTHY